ncbi:hypothetical protein [Caulobacter vibrioides]|uniref:Uncharacterized protein n=1 Tax=Caulobacter vibrioides (strain NA1000 / CB15N) TaxID=565050 RepID=A0A0H3CAE4_CAUVN|nr:hypothetical protein [Caulobacter vibrioides]YP_002517197.1 hypothetical protein CCNA_01824 [Caulobacter vibrioides NA1000]ACL95289.1 hypothetical protein CCNA_01824 [Caulobacter vibrioides NA1000]QXZ53808.1 hypothetical protein KZH45_09125 [Caulobacter vibrioides]
MSLGGFDLGPGIRRGGRVSGERLEPASDPGRTFENPPPQRGRRPKAGGGSAAEPASSPSVGFADTSPARGRIGPLPPSPTLAMSACWIDDRTVSSERPNPRHRTRISAPRS